ncbi:s4-like RNA-binding protein [Mycoplasmopsis maculosa]|uniref:S4-like RNA-binding protein n=1 Tax=Mycoplasmopsis maculosa TaxID=114885 RepID=A0A449B4V7_9BACT|nr:RNA-binding S4 domain-containing protein [Mycoplasmopsis maculosa]VEU75622.1 s4-like RNA-binding protein [Mycoplasmopsis maculosa]
MNSEIIITKDFIEIGKLIKKIGLITTGGAIKVFLKNNIVKINNVTPQGRSTKVYPDDIIWINDDVYVVKREK